MAKPITPTPVVKGIHAKKIRKDLFDCLTKQRSTEEIDKLSKELVEMRRCYEIAQSMFVGQPSL